MNLSITTDKKAAIFNSLKLANQAFNKMVGSFEKRANQIYKSQ